MTPTGKRYLLFGTIATVALFVVLELVLRIVVNLSVDYISRREDINHEYRLWQMHLFNSFLGMNEPDPDLFWRLKPGYRDDFISVNNEGSEGPEIAVKQPDEYRILFLGDSTPLGLGLNKSSESFVHQLESLLKTREPGRTITVVNASVAGFTSWQCRKQLELLGERLQPDLVITYFGNNDPSINGYLSDRQLYDQTRYSSTVNRVLAHSYIYQLLKGLVLGAKSKVQADSVLLPRVDVTEAAENLTAIHDWCSQRNRQLIVCTVASPDLWPPGIQFKVFARGKDSEDRLVMSEQLQENLLDQWALCLDTTLLPGQADQWSQHVYRSSYQDGKSPAENATEYRSLLERAPSSARLWNNLGVALWQQGIAADSVFERAIAFDSSSAIAFYNAGIALYAHDLTRAEAYLKHAKELDNYSLRIKPPYNESYRRLCQEWSVPVADIEQLLAGMPENEYFVDHCHPSLSGHELIAGALAEIVLALLK